MPGMRLTPGSMSMMPGLVLWLGLALLLGACAYEPQPVKVHPKLSQRIPAWTQRTRGQEREVQARMDRRHNNFAFAHREPAIFSVKAQEVGAHGPVRVRARVDAAGVVQDVEILGQAHPLVRPAVLEAARRCTFKRRYPTDESGGYEVRFFYQF